MMTKLTKNGVTTTKKNGEENYESFQNRKKTFIQYDYRHTNGKLFSIVKPTLEKCREARDQWLKNNGS